MKSGQSFLIHGQWAIFRHFSQEWPAKLALVFGMVLLAFMTMIILLLFAGTLARKEYVWAIVMAFFCGIHVWAMFYFFARSRRFSCVALNRMTGDFRKLEIRGSQVALKEPLSRFSCMELRHFPLRQLPNWLQPGDWSAWLVLENGKRIHLANGGSSRGLAHKLSSLIGWLNLPLVVADKEESIMVAIKLELDEKALWRRCAQRDEPQHKIRSVFICAIRLVGSIASAIFAFLIVGMIWHSMRGGVDDESIGVVTLMWFLLLFTVSVFYWISIGGRRGSPEKIEPCDLLVSKLDEGCD